MGYACKILKMKAVPDGTGHAQARPNLVLITTVLASSLAFIDGSVVNVGLPAIGSAFRASAVDLQWVINAYLLPLSALCCWAARWVIDLAVCACS